MVVRYQRFVKFSGFLLKTFPEAAQAHPRAPVVDVQKYPRLGVPAGDEVVRRLAAAVVRLGRTRLGKKLRVPRQDDNPVQQPRVEDVKIRAGENFHVR